MDCTATLTDSTWLWQTPDVSEGPGWLWQTPDVSEGPGWLWQTPDVSEGPGWPWQTLADHGRVPSELQPRQSPR
jgi:hypothetical protein